MSKRPPLLCGNCIKYQFTPDRLGRCTESDTIRVFAQECELGYKDENYG